MIQDFLLGGENVDLLFDSNILVLLIKRMGGETEGLVIIVVWSALIVSRWVVVAWGRTFCLGLVEISSLVFLVLFKLSMLAESSVSFLVSLWSKRYCGHKGGNL